MKRVIALIMVFTLLVLGCSSNRNISETNNKTSNDEIASENQQLSINIDLADYDVNKLSDVGLTEYLEDYVYVELIEQLDEGYFIENVDAIYISKEYIEELEFNSKSNVFFGYTLQDIEMAFNDVKYVFSLGEDGSTIVRESELYDDTFDKVIKNVLVGSGVIVVCVTVSAVTAGTAPAISMIFAVSAKTATECAVSGAVISGATTVAVNGVQTGDWDKSLKEGVVAASKEFKWGAIGGAIGGGVFEALSLKGATLNGLTMNEAAKIQRESKLPLGFIKKLDSTKQYDELKKIADNGGPSLMQMSQIFKNTDCSLDIIKYIKNTDDWDIYFKQAGLTPTNVNGKSTLIRDLDLEFKSELDGKTVTNLERMKKGRAAVDPLSGKPYELHHMGQETDSPLAILTHTEHMENGNNPILHNIKNKEGEGVHCLISDSVWGKQRADYWKELAKFLEK